MVLDKEKGAIRLNGLEKRKSLVNKILGAKYKNYYCDEYAKAMAESIEGMEGIAKFLGQANVKTKWETGYEFLQTNSSELQTDLEQKEFESSARPSKNQKKEERRKKEAQAKKNRKKGAGGKRSPAPVPAPAPLPQPDGDSMNDDNGMGASSPIGSKLQSQLKQVAKLIITHKERKAEREVFLVSHAGFDTHSNMLEITERLFGELNWALKTFTDELKAHNLFESVVIATHSDFGRTLIPNSKQGTDHAYAGNHIVIGGDLDGGQVFNQFPHLLEDSEQSISRGRLIPKYPWESMMFPIADWMGVEQSQMETVFPNLRKFDPSKHIISKLFK